MGVYNAGVAIEITETFTLSAVPTNPTTVTFSVLAPDGTLTNYVFGVALEVSNPSVGVFVLGLDPPALPGVYHYEITGTGAVEAGTGGEFTVLQSAVDPIEVGWASTGPCTAWCDEQDVRNCCDDPDVDVVPCPELAASVQAASELLYGLSGRIYAGLCQKTVRPCGNFGCGFQLLSRGYVVWPEERTAYNYFWGWTGWAWQWPAFGGCGCQPLDRVVLDGYPIREILEVKIDGAVVPELDNWRLDRNRFLTRKADASGNAQWWPSCQRLDMDDTEAGTFSVQYSYGQDPPIIGRLAAAQLACEIFKACPGVGGECSLPSGTVRVTRQGVTVDKLAALGWVRGKFRGTEGYRTGITLVDAFLNTLNPAGLTRRPVIVTPGRRIYPESISS